MTSVRDNLRNVWNAECSNVLSFAQGVENALRYFPKSNLKAAIFEADKLDFGNREWVKFVANQVLNDPNISDIDLKIVFSKIALAGGNNRKLMDISKV